MNETGCLQTEQDINELESLVDWSAHSPELSPGHPFTAIQEVY